MTINEILAKKGMTKYRLAKQSGVPHATLSELCSGKTNIGKCSAETLYKISKALGVSMEAIIEGNQKSDIEYVNAYEYGLPGYLQKDLDAFKEGLDKKSGYMDCLWGELYGSINAALIDDRLITEEHAEYLRNKYLRR